MSMLKTLTLVHVLLCMGGVTSAKDDPELITFVLTQNAEAANHLLSLSYKTEYECDMDLGDGPPAVGSTAPSVGDPKVPVRMPGFPLGGRTHATGCEEVIQKGNLRWTSREEHKRWETDGRLQDLYARTVTNNDYVAMWEVGHPFAYQFDHESTSSISLDVTTRLTRASSHDSMHYTMGPRDRNYLRYYMETRDTRHWEIEERVLGDSSSCFYVKEYSGPKSDSNQLASILVIDPKKDFLVTRSTYFRPDGTIAAEVDVTLEKSANANLWLPRAIEERRHYPASHKRSQEDQLMKRLRIRLTEVLANPTIDDKQFTLEALQIPDGVRLIRRFSTGMHDTLVRRGDSYEPEAVAAIVDQSTAMPPEGTSTQEIPNMQEPDRSRHRQMSSGGRGRDAPNEAVVANSGSGHRRHRRWIAYGIIAPAIILPALCLCAVLRRRERRRTLPN